MLKPGTKVLLENSKQKERKGGKLQERWLGPYSISRSLGKGLYELKTLNGSVMKKKANINRLKVYSSTYFFAFSLVFQEYNAPAGSYDDNIEDMETVDVIEGITDTHDDGRSTEALLEVVSPPPYEVEASLPQEEISDKVGCFQICLLIFTLNLNL